MELILNTWLTYGYQNQCQWVTVFALTWVTELVGTSYAQPMELTTQEKKGARNADTHAS